MSSEFGHVIVPKRTRFEYTYTDLENIATCRVSQVHIYGVIKFTSGNRKPTRGTSHYVTISLHNEAMYTTNSRFTVSLFANFEQELPLCDVGDIIRLQHVYVEKFRGVINGKLRLSLKGSWLLFHKDNTTMKWDGSSMRHPEFESKEEAIIAKLRDWRDLTNPCDTVPSSAESVTSDGAALSNITNTENETAQLPSSKAPDHTTQTRSENTSDHLTPHSSSGNPEQNQTRKAGDLGNTEITSTCGSVSNDITKCSYCAGGGVKSVEISYIHEGAIATSSNLPHILAEVDGHLKLCSLANMEKVKLNTTDSRVSLLRTRLQVGSLVEVSVSDLQSFQQSGMFTETPLLCQMTCDILPTFTCSQSKLKTSSEASGLPSDSRQMLLHVCLRDVSEKRKVVTASINEQNLRLLCLTSEQGETNHLHLLSKLIPKMVVASTDPPLAVDYVTRATLIVKLFGKSVWICHTKRGD